MSPVVELCTRSDRVVVQARATIPAAFVGGLALLGVAVLPPGPRPKRAEESRST
jgi:hypothetical protein